MRDLENRIDVELMVWNARLFNETQKVKLVAKESIKAGDVIFNKGIREENGYKILEVVEQKKSKIKKFPLYITAIAVKCPIYKYVEIQDDDGKVVNYTQQVLDE